MRPAALVLILALATSAWSCANADRFASQVRAGEQPLHVVCLCTITDDPTRPGWRRYEYSFRNGSQSRDTVDCFALREAGICEVRQSPRAWLASHGEYQGEPRSLVWSAIGTDTTLDNDLSFFRSPPDNALAPGMTASGFVLLARGPSSRTRLYASPYDSHIAESEDEHPGPFTPILSLWDSTAIGEIEVPAPGDFTSGRSNRRSSLHISLVMNRPGYVRLDVVDSASTPIATLKSQRCGVGTHTVDWTGKDRSGRTVAAGNYGACLMVDGETIAVHRFVHAPL